jgi:hypothetical protein
MSHRWVLGATFEHLISLDPSIDLEKKVKTRSFWRQRGKLCISGYTGNAGPSVDEVYHRYALLILPTQEEWEQTLQTSGLFGLMIYAQEELQTLKTPSKDQLASLEIRVHTTLTGSRSYEIGGGSDVAILEAGLTLAASLCSLTIARDIIQVWAGSLPNLNDPLGKGVAPSEKYYFKESALTPALEMFGWDKVSELIVPGIAKLPNALDVFSSLCGQNFIVVTPAFAETFYSQVWHLHREKFIRPGEFVKSIKLLGCLIIPEVADKIVADIVQHVSYVDLGGALETVFANYKAPIPLNEIFYRKLVQGRLDYASSIYSKGSMEFSWCMPLAKFSENNGIQSFLHGPLNKQTFDKRKLTCF